MKFQIGDRVLEKKSDVSREDNNYVIIDCHPEGYYDLVDNFGRFHKVNFVTANRFFELMPIDPNNILKDIL